MSRLAASAGLPTSNWAGNVTWKAARHHAPESVEELQRVVHEAAGMVRVVGTRHSFSDIADTRDRSTSTSYLDLTPPRRPQVPHSFVCGIWGKDQRNWVDKN